MDIDYEYKYLPLHITKLESPEDFQVWVREMREYLIAVILWRWTEEENSEVPTADIPDLANDGSNQLVRATALAALEERVLTWETGNDLASNAIRSRLGTNYFLDFRNETNAHKLWKGIARDCKPKGSVMLNELHRRLTTLSLRSCKDEVHYACQFRSIHNQILEINPGLRVETHFLTFLFYNGLGKEDWVHLPIDKDRMPWA